MKWYQLIEANKDELARLLTLEQGKPLADAYGEIQLGNSYVLWYAEETKRAYGQTVPASVANKRLLVPSRPSASWRRSRRGTSRSPWSRAKWRRLLRRDAPL